jgi:transposase
MRKQIDGLAILAKEVIQQDPTSGALFAFINARRNKLKLLVWERNGFIVWYKRLERDKFHWPRATSEAVVTLSGEQLNWLLDGYDVWRMKPHEVLHFSVFS